MSPSIEYETWGLSHILKKLAQYGIKNEKTVYLCGFHAFKRKFRYCPVFNKANRGGRPMFRTMFRTMFRRKTIENQAFLQKTKRRNVRNIVPVL